MRTRLFGIAICFILLNTVAAAGPHAEGPESTNAQTLSPEGRQINSGKKVKDAGHEIDPNTNLRSAPIESVTLIKSFFVEYDKSRAYFQNGNKLLGEPPAGESYCWIDTLKIADQWGMLIEPKEPPTAFKVTWVLGGSFVNPFVFRSDKHDVNQWPNTTIAIEGAKNIAAFGCHNPSLVSTLADFRQHFRGIAKENLKPRRVEP